MSSHPNVVVFTGHMIDLPNRKERRFPPTLENTVRAEIAERLARHNSPASLGIASGARGGDILFHEEARRLNIPTMIVLPLSVERFEKTSVAGVVSGEWIQRFRQLWRNTPSDLAIVLSAPENESPFAICNTEMLRRAAERGHVYLIALWDGADNGKPGGTADMIRQARLMGVPVEVIKTGDLTP